MGGAKELSSSASLGFTDYSQVDMLVSRYKFVNFEAGKGMSSRKWCAPVPAARGAENALVAVWGTSVGCRVWGLGYLCGHELENGLDRPPDVVEAHVAPPCESCTKAA